MRSRLHSVRAQMLSVRLALAMPWAGGGRCVWGGGGKGDEGKEQGGGGCGSVCRMVAGGGVCWGAQGGEGGCRRGGVHCNSVQGRGGRTVL
jgi:hypothetical protein